MEKTIINIDGLSVYAVKNPHGIVVLPCASCKYEKEESSGNTVKIVVTELKTILLIRGDEQ